MACDVSPVAMFFLNFYSFPLKVVGNRGHAYWILKYWETHVRFVGDAFLWWKAPKGNGFLWNGIRSEEQRAKGLREKNFSYRMQGHEIEHYPEQTVLPQFSLGKGLISYWMLNCSTLARLVLIGVEILIWLKTLSIMLRGVERKMSVGKQSDVKKSKKETLLFPNKWLVIHRLSIWDRYCSPAIVLLPSSASLPNNCNFISASPSF